MGKGVVVALALIVVFGVILWLVAPSMFSGNSALPAPPANTGAGMGEYANATPVDVEVGYGTIDFLNWTCKFEVNSSVVEYVCSGWQPWVRITLSDGRNLSWRAMEEEGRRVPRRIFYEVVEVADLRKRVAQVIIEAGTERLGLKHFRAVVENTTFGYGWVSLGDVASYGWDPALLRNGSFALNLAFLTCGQANGTLACSPMPEEKVGHYMEYAKLYSEALREVGVNLSLRAVPAGKWCRWEAREGGLPEVSCRDVGGVPTDPVAVLPLPSAGWKDVGGLYDMGTRTIYVGYRGDPAIFMHELGHALGLPDIYKLPGFVPELELSVFNHSIMGGWVLVKHQEANAIPGSISLGDFALLSAEAWYILNVSGRPHLAEAVKNRLLALGINPANASILLPLTPEGKLPPAVRALYTSYFLEVNWRDASKSHLNTALLQALKEVAKWSKK